MTGAPEFDQFVEYVDSGGVHAVSVEQHSLESPYTLAALNQGYQHVAALGRSVTLGDEQLNAVRAAVPYHQDVINNEIVSSDPAVIVARLAWVRSRPEWYVGLACVAANPERTTGVYYNPADANLYACIQAHITQEAWRPDLPGLGALWVRHYTEEWPEWAQPYGGSGTYVEGAKVTHNGQRWINVVPAPTLNVWEPGVYGWEVA